MNADAPLHSLLLTWKVEPSPDPDFHRTVWSRIARTPTRRTTRVFSAVRDWFMLTLPRPVYATAFVALFALAGFGIAGGAARRAERAEHVELKERYLTSIDPLAMASAALRRP